MPSNEDEKLSQLLGFAKSKDQEDGVRIINSRVISFYNLLALNLTTNLHLCLTLKEC